MKETYSIEDFYHIVQNEGLEYTILHYLDIENIEDKKLKKLCQKANKALCDIDTFLTENGY